MLTTNWSVSSSLISTPPGISVFPLVSSPLERLAQPV